MRQLAALRCAFSLCIGAASVGCTSATHGVDTSPAAATTREPTSTPTAPRATSIVEPVVIEKRRCWQDAPPSGTYAPRAAQPSAPHALVQGPEVALVDGCVGIASGLVGMTTNGAVSFDGRIHATGDRYWTEVVVEGSELAMRSAHSRYPHGVKEVGATTPLVRTTALDARDHRAQLALLEHESTAVRRAALERLLPEQNDPATCSALIASTVASKDRDALQRLIEALRGACAPELIRNVLDDTHWTRQAAEGLRAVVASTERATLLQAFLDRHLTSHRPMPDDDGRLSYAASFLLPLHPQACATSDRTGPTSTPVDCSSEAQARTFVAMLDARLARFANDERAAQVVLKLLHGFLGPRLASVHLLADGPTSCAVRAAAMSSIKESVWHMQPSDVLAAFERGLASAVCPAARERASVALAARLHSFEAEEAVWALLLREVQGVTDNQPLLEELRTELARDAPCVWSSFGPHAQGDALMQRLGITRCK